MEESDSKRRYKLRLWFTCILIALLFLGVIYLDVPQTNLVEYFRGAVKFVLSLIPGIQFDVTPGVPTLFLDLFLFILAYLVGVAFFAQFALPVHNVVQRWLAFTYLLRYPFRHGPLVFIKDGVIPGRYPKGEVKRAGILLFDTASAGVLRTRSAFTRAVGPGVVFTRDHEYLAGAVDLHRIAWPKPPLGWGPDPEEDPFAPRDEKKESQDQFDHRQQRRFSTSGETRDGVEVVANIFVLSQIDSSVPDSSAAPPLSRKFKDRFLPYMQSDIYTRFEYNSEAVRLAITGEEINPKVTYLDPERRRLPWYQLPAYLAVDLWREYLRKFTFEELFKELPDYNKMTALQVIQQMVANRLQREQVFNIGPNGERLTEFTDSREFQVLRDRGIKVLYAPIRNIRFHKQVDQQLEDKWFTSWKWQAERERDSIERLRSYSMHEGELDALRDFSFNASRRVYQEMSRLRKPRDDASLFEQMRQSLVLMLRGTLRLCLGDTSLHHRLLGEETQLISIIEWVRQSKASAEKTDTEMNSP